MHDMDEMYDLTRRMEDIVYCAGLPAFDRVILKTEYDELWFLWSDDKRLVIVELRDTSMDSLRAAIESEAAYSGDPVLN